MAGGFPRGELGSDAWMPSRMRRRAVSNAVSGSRSCARSTNWLTAGIVAAGQDALYQWRVAGAPVVLGQPGAAACFLLCVLVQREAGDERVEGRRRARRVGDLEPGAGQGGERELKWPQEARQHRRPAAHEQGGPGVGTHHAPLGVRQQGEVVTPRAAGPRGQLDPGIRRVDHQIQQLLAAGDVPVQRHGPGPESSSDAAHADRIDSVPVRDRDGRGHNLLAAQPLRREPRRRLRSVHPLTCPASRHQSSHEAEYTVLLRTSYPLQEQP